MEDSGVKRRALDCAICLSQLLGGLFGIPIIVGMFLRRKLMRIKEQRTKEQKTKERVLMFSSREICYLSSNFFANQLGAAFEELGFVADVCELTKEDNLDERLEPFIGREYRVILDFNSLLPRMVMDDGEAYLDHLKGPFFDYILDHPLFHYNGLMAETENFHVLVLDEAQRRYVERYYPNVKKVHMLPLGATEAFYHGKKQKADHILFLGTYDRPDTVYELVKSSPEPLKSIMKELIEHRVYEPLIPMEEAFSQYIKDKDLEVDEAQFALYMNAMYPVDVYIRDYFRREALDELLSHDIPVKVVGEGWEKYRSPREDLFIREKAVPFALSFEKIAQEQILLNVSPIFNRGMHDRIPAGMANRAAVLSDGNPYLEKTFLDDKNICFYSLKNLKTLREKAEILLKEAAARERIQQCGYEEFRQKHTWKCRAEQILEWADEMTGIVPEFFDSSL